MNPTNTNKIYSWVIIILIIINIATLGFLIFSFSKRPPPQFPPPVSGRKDAGDPKDILEKFIKTELKFDDYQTTKLGTIMNKHHKERENLLDSLKILKDEIAGEIKSEKPDEAKIKLISQKIGQYQSEIELSRFRNLVEIKSLCNPEQLKLFGELIDNIKTVMPPPEQLPPGR
jgi:hypothetical protein